MNYFCSGGNFDTSCFLDLKLSSSHTKIKHMGLLVHTLTLLLKVEAVGSDWALDGALAAVLVVSTGHLGLHLKVLSSQARINLK